jgi:type VI secretion system VasD/TssJ family lipoprotein
VAAGTLLLAACASSPSPRDACLLVRASGSLNTYDGQPHVVVLQLYPLGTSGGFEQLSASDLLRGTQPAGAAGPPLQVTIAPGEAREVRETFPAGTNHLGLLADYYREPGAGEGTRKAVVAAGCGRFGRVEVVLSPSDLLVE